MRKKTSNLARVGEINNWKNVLNFQNYIRTGLTLQKPGR